MSKNKFYITTSIAYANAEPHIGYALELLQADVLARYHRQKGDDVFFLTGMDEHGKKKYNKKLNCFHLFCLGEDFKVCMAGHPVTAVKICVFTVAFDVSDTETLHTQFLQSLLHLFTGITTKDGGNLSILHDVTSASDQSLIQCCP